jgi:type II secretory pathway component GspD/PulD (secretin)
VVTPQINDDGYITMLVEPSVTKTVAAKVSPPAGTGDVRDPRTRSTRALLRIRSGETLVIGGLIDREDTQTLRKVPILGDIPVVGEVFRNNEINDAASELVVFVTPRILDEMSRKLAGSPAPFSIREQEPGDSRQYFIEDSLNRLEQPSAVP